MILCAGNVNGGIGSKEICWAEVDLMYLNRPIDSISIYVPRKVISGMGSYMTGQSSTLGLCLESWCQPLCLPFPGYCLLTVRPNVCQTTTSSFSTSSFLATASATPSTSFLL